MGILVGCEQISMEWPGKKVLTNQTIGVNEGDRIGVVGKNGDGKSTLLDLIAHRIEPDSGNVIWRSGIQVGYMGQSDSLSDTQTVCSAVVGDTPEYEWASDARIRKIIDELIGDLDWNGLVGELSGGQRRRCDLARLLVGTWDLMLIDEPTNHLDLHAIQWLANHLKNRWSEGNGALILVTHDRWFLDEVCDHMWEVHDGVIDPFDGGYSAYIQARVERDRQAAVMEERRQNTLRKELNWLAHGAKARTSKPKFRIDAAMELLAEDPPLRNTLELKRMAVSRLGKQVIEMHDVSFAYKNAAQTTEADQNAQVDVIKHVEWLIGPGDRYGILGENGAGKSTLLELMTQQLHPTSGLLKVGKSVKFGWLSQQIDTFATKEAWTVLELLGQYKTSYLVNGKMQSPTQLLESLGFDRREFTNRLQDLSGGQRRRLALLCVLLEEPNVLVLDEPGNDLDTDMLAVLEDLLDSWPGTLLVVSHDRFLIERVTDDQYALIEGHIRHVPGGVDEYLKLVDAAKQTARRAGELSGARGSSGANEPQVDGSSRQEGAVLSNAERRELKKRFDSIERRMGKAQELPGQIRKQMSSADATDAQRLMELQQQLDDAEAALTELEDEWLTLAEKLGEA